VIYIRLELWPQGNKARARVLHEGIIHNTGGDGSTGEYEYLFSCKGGFKATDRQIAAVEVKNVVRRGEVKEFPRLRLYAVDLLYRALRSAFGERNPAK
jgi:hypothetical protein